MEAVGGTYREAETPGHVIVEAEKEHGLASASWCTGKDCALVWRLKNRRAEGCRILSGFKVQRGWRQWFASSGRDADILSELLCSEPCALIGCYHGEKAEPLLCSGYWLESSDSLRWCFTSSLFSCTESDCRTESDCHTFQKYILDVSPLKNDRQRRWWIC